MQQRDADLIEAARVQAQRRSSPGLRSPGGSIPGYRVLRELHRGGQGVVYLALQENAKRQVAIKVMREGPVAGPHDRVRFEREVTVLAQLNNPNIVAIHDSGVTGGSFYYVMDYIAGPTLDEWVRDRALSVRETLKLFHVVCQAVNAAHLRGVIHRDLKPSNIRVTPEGEPKVLDFGLAKVLDVSRGEHTVATQMTMTGQFVGSLPWSSPEQARGEAGGIDVRTDVYALGVILYQLLTGRFPYRVQGPMREVLEHIVNTEPKRPGAFNARVGPELEALILKPLSKDREQRYQTAGEFARDIERYLADEPIEAKRHSRRYLLRKLVKRYWIASAVGAGAIAAVVIGLVTAIVLYRRELDMREQHARETMALQSEIRRLEEQLGRLSPAVEDGPAPEPGEAGRKASAPPAAP